jgi:hypothetical protein
LLENLFLLIPLNFDLGRGFGKLLEMLLVVYKHKRWKRPSSFNAEGNRQKDK